MLVALGFPLLLLAGLEMGLRLFGYGYPTSFLLRTQIRGQEMLVDNAKFGWRFFPPAIARSPTPIAMQAKKPSGVYRIFLFGESAVLGDPRPSYGVAHYLEVILEERFPGTRFEVIPAAMTAINSHVMLPIAREFANYDGDLWIVYAGNNEYIGPFGPNTVFGTASLPLPTVRLKLALEATKTGQLLSSIRERIRPQNPKTDWSGLKMFQENQLAAGDPRRAVVDENYRRNLEDVLKAGVRAGVPVLLSTMASNLRDCAPFGSLHSPPLSGADLSPWEELYRTASTNSGQSAWAEATAGFRSAVQKSPQHAESYFRLAQCEEALGQTAEAKKHYLAARDLDAMPFRAGSSLNSRVRDLAQKHALTSVTFVDSEKSLSEASPGQISGREFFYEHVHLTPEGNYRLALTWAEAILPKLPAKLTDKKTPSWADADVCAQKLGLSDWNRSSMLEEIARRLADAPYTSQFNHTARRAQLLEQIAELREKLHPRNITDARVLFEEALRQRPDRVWLHQNYAEFLELSGNLEKAAAEWQTVRDFLPHHHVGHFQAGRLLSQLRKYEEARKAMEEVLRIRPDLEEAYLELGQAYAGQRKWDEALKQYALAQKYRPNDPRIPLRRADVLAAQNKREEAIQNLREAIRLRSSYWEARYLLGVELALDQKLAEAQTEFQEVVRLKPDHIAGRFNLAVALAKQNKLSEAMREFEETLKRDPEHKQARQYLDALRGAAR